MLLLLTAAWVPLYLQRRHAHQPNVDDYLYTLQAWRLAHAGSFVDFLHGFLHTGQTAPLVILLAAPGALHGVDGAAAIELPLLLFLAAGGWLLARRWVGPWQAALVGLAAAGNQAVLGWSLMVHFSVAASALCVWALASYLWSDGFQRWAWSLATGAAVGLLLLSRSLAPAYVAPFVVVVVGDLVRRRRLPLDRAAAAAALAFAIAGPWWIVSGGTALHYLRSAGYQTSSGFTTTGAHLSVHSIVNRIWWTLSDLGTVQSLILVAAPWIALAHRRRMPGASVVAAWISLTLIVLATSSNIGTGFGLPLVAVAITLGGALVFTRGANQQDTASEQSSYASSPEIQPEQSRRSWRRRVAVTAAVLTLMILIVVLIVSAIARHGRSDLNWPVAALAVILVGALLTFRSFGAVLFLAVVVFGVAATWWGGTTQSWLGPPYRKMAIQAAGGGPTPNIDTTHQRVADAIAGRPTLLVRADDLLNANGLAYTAATQDLQLDLVPTGSGSPRAAEQGLDRAQLLLTGASPAPYDHYTSAVTAAAASNGWTKVKSWSPACGNTVELWEKGGRGQSRPNSRAHSAYEATTLADHPAAYWRLGDRTCSADDSSGHDNLADISGSPDLSVAPLTADPDGAIRLDGKKDGASFESSLGLGAAKAITIEAWVRPDDVPESNYAAWQLVSKWNTALLYLRGGRQATFVFALYNPGNASYKPLITSKTPVVAHQTYHVVGTYDGRQLRIYVNGALDTTKPYGGGLSDSPYGGALAAKGWGPLLPSPRFRGVVDEVAIYGHALPPDRIRAHYRAGTKP
jgi:hypothetical protein